MLPEPISVAEPTSVQGPALPTEPFPGAFLANPLCKQKIIPEVENLLQLTRDVFEAIRAGIGSFDLELRAFSMDF